MTEVKIEELDLNDRPTIKDAFLEARNFARTNQCAVVYTHRERSSLVIQNSWEQDSGISIGSAANIVSVFKLINENQAEVELDKTREKNYIIKLPHDPAKEPRAKYIARAEALYSSLNNLLKADRAPNAFSFDATTGVITHVKSFYAMPTKLLAEISTQQQQQQQLARSH